MSDGIYDLMTTHAEEMVTCLSGEVQETPYFDGLRNCILNSTQPMPTEPTTTEQATTTSTEFTTILITDGPTTDSTVTPPI